MDCPVQEFLPVLIPFNEPIKTHTRLEKPSFLTWESIFIHVRAEDARGVDFEELVNHQIRLREGVSKARANGEKAFLPSLDLPRPPAGSDIPNRKQRLEMGFRALKFYAAIQRELRDPRNNNRINGRLPWATNSTRTTNVIGRPRDAEHCAHGAGSRHLSKTSAETAES